MNITDIDDKIINRSNEKQMDFMEFKSIQEASFLEDMKCFVIQELECGITRYHDPSHGVRSRNHSIYRKNHREPVRLRIQRKCVLRRQEIPG